MIVWVVELKREERRATRREADVVYAAGLVQGMARRFGTKRVYLGGLVANLAPAG